VYLLADFDARLAEREYREAIRLDSSSAYAHYGYAYLLALQERFDEARAAIGRARERDPVSALIGMQAGRIEYFARNYSLSVSLLRDLLEHEPSFSAAHYYLALSLAHLGRFEEARAELRLARLSAAVIETDTAGLSAMAGDRGPAKLLLARRRATLSGRDDDWSRILLPAADAGEIALAIEALESMVHSREIEVLSIRVDPRFDSLRSDQRFQRLAVALWNNGAR
jgi:tetratricopeptide (TPR) repeat protein